MKSLGQSVLERMVEGMSFTMLYGEDHVKYSMAGFNTVVK